MVICVPPNPFLTPFPHLPHQLSTLYSTALTTKVESFVPLSTHKISEHVCAHVIARRSHLELAGILVVCDVDAGLCNIVMFRNR